MMVFATGAWLIIQGSKLLQGVLIASAIMAGCWVWLEQHDAKQQAIGANDVIQTTNRQVEQKVAKAIEDSKAAEKPGSDRRLHERWCRDCK